MSANKKPPKAEEPIFDDFQTLNKKRGRKRNDEKVYRELDPHE